MRFVNRPSFITVAVAAGISGAFLAVQTPLALASTHKAVPLRHVDISSTGLSFDIPANVHRVPVSILKGKRRHDVRYLAVRARRDGVAVEDVIIAERSAELPMTAKYVHRLLAVNGSTNISISTAKVSFGRVLRGTVEVRHQSAAKIYSTIYLFYRDNRSYEVAFNGLTRRSNNVLASIVMGTWGS